MTDIIASPAVKEAVKIVMEQQERLGKNAAEAVSAADLPGASQPIRASVLRAAQLAHEAEDHARNRQHGIPSVYCLSLPPFYPNGFLSSAG